MLLMNCYIRTKLCLKEQIVLSQTLPVGVPDDHLIYSPPCSGSPVHWAEGKKEREGGGGYLGMSEPEMECIGE